MNRRRFIRSLVSAVASIAIASKLAPNFPEFKENTLLTPEEMGQRMAEALARSMAQTRENVASRVFCDDDSYALHVEGISAEEMYVQN